MTALRGGDIRVRVRTAGVLVALALACGCSSQDPEQVTAWQRDYCGKLGLWQHGRDSAVFSGAARAEVATGSVGAADASVIEARESAGRAAIAASAVLDREQLDRDGSHILADTHQAVMSGDLRAEARAVRYCDGAGFETLVGATGD
ncbi:hypothetical protein ACFYV5_17840 [Streptomyces sp. NPDC003035]|uniref:hypothetical protein n=1 Tax=Streptomyces sp. NPDC003035 TaxID=3364676 RepID=UPI0036B3CB97